MFCTRLKTFARLCQGNAYDVIPGYTKEETEDIYNEMLQVLCMPMRHGSHYGATSTNDPTFWLIHPTFDRCYLPSALCLCFPSHVCNPFKSAFPFLNFPSLKVQHGSVNKSGHRENRHGSRYAVQVCCFCQADLSRASYHTSWQWNDFLVSFP